MSDVKSLAGARSAFECLPSENVSKCKICGAKVPGQHLENLKNHLRQKHEEFYNDRDEEDEPIEERVQPSKKRKIVLEYDADEVKEAWLNLVVIEGRPFTILDSTSLRTMLSPIFGALEINMLTSHNVHLAITTRADEVVADIKKTLGKKIFSLKMDSATRQTRRVICLNAQAVIKGGIKIFTLAMCEMGVDTPEHTSKNVNVALRPTYLYSCFCVMKLQK